MKSIINKILFSLICFLSIHNVLAQNDSSKLIIALDSLSPNQSKNVIIDSSTITGKKEIRISKDALPNIITYGAVDSNFTDIINKQIHLYGKSFVNFEKVKINADYVVVNFGTNIVSAFAQRDSTYIAKEKPTFTDGDTKAGFEKIAYNFKTKKAFINELTTQESEFFIVGEKSKFVAKNDSLKTEDKIYQEGAIISTCSHNPPHFGIRTRKMKMVPKKIAVMGPAQLEIAGIPTPLILPFGFFPLIKGRSSGIIFPSDYNSHPDLGFGLQGVGYYFPINDNIDATVRGDIWTRGTYRLQTTSKYLVKYKYSGNIDINFANNVTEDAKGNGISQKSFGITLSHSQDPKAHPYRTLGGSINIQTNKNGQRTKFDAATRLNNKLYSNFNYTYRWPESPFRLGASFNHKQDNNTRVVNVEFPNLAVNMNTIQPFKRKNASGDPLWYENISVDYNAKFNSYVRSTDTTLFTKATLDNIETGFNHGTNVSTSARALKYFSISPSIGYNETYFLKTLDKNLYADTIGVDTIPKGENSYELNYRTSAKVKDELQREFSILRKFNAGIGVNTAIFGKIQFKKGWLKGLRHTMKPTISFNYSPDTELKFRKLVYTKLDRTDSTYYSPFQTGAFPQGLNSEQLALSYNISNIFEAKYRNKKDTVDKKFNFFNNIYVGGNYNFAADSFKWSDTNISGNADLIKGFSSVQFGLQLTPYQIDYKKNRKINAFLIDRANDKQLLQLVTFNMGFNTTLSYEQLKNVFSPKNKDEKAQQQRLKRGPISFSSLFDKLRLNHNFTVATTKTKTGRDSLFVGAHGIYISGNIPLSKNWDINIGSVSYDLKAGRLVYPSFGFSRDLHCWNMRFSWYPDSGVYSFFIGVKSGALNFLKYDYNQPYYNPKF